VVAALALLLLAATPADDARARAAVSVGNWADLARLEVSLSARGETAHGGLIGLALDVSKVARCLPLPPLPTGDAPEIRDARWLLRLESLRILRHRTEGAYPDDLEIRTVIARGPAWSTPSTRGAPGWVAWPISTEVWPDEVLEPAVAPSRCAPAEARPDVVSRSSDEGQRAVDLIAHGEGVPLALRAPLVLLALTRGGPLSASATVAAWLDGTSTEVASAARVRLARRAEAIGQNDRAIALYREVMFEGSDEEAGWARARLARLLEAPREILEIARGARNPRPLDRASLVLAEARALYALGDLDGLERFGRATLPQLDLARAPPAIRPYHAAVIDLLALLALARDPDRAIAWTESLGSPSERDALLTALAERALDSQRFDLAAAVYDDLRRTATRERIRGGAPVATRLARWIAGRARVEQARGDPAAFAAFVDELRAQALAEADRPLARTAPHRELAALAQALLGPLTNAKAQPLTPQFAATLVGAIDALLVTPTRWSPILSGYRGPLAELAGVESKSAPSGKPIKPIRSVGVIALPRLLPSLPAPDEEPPLPAVGSFWVYPAERGIKVGLPPWPPPT